MNTKTTSCIVMYQNDIAMLERAITSILSVDTIDKLFLIDNSPTNYLQKLANHHKIEYIHNPLNPGFGSSHNVAINRAFELGAKMHFVINPDIYFEEDVITPMVEYMSNDSSIGMIMPQILNLDQTVQNLPKLLPTPFSILLRKIKKPTKIYNNFIKRYELRDVDTRKIYNTPILSGCFTLLNLEAIKKVGSYDDKYFMYFEDWDLSRRVHKYFKTIYFPNVSVVHEYESGANKNRRLFKIYINSALTYFNKWGWIFDSDRKIMNKQALDQFK